MPDDLMVSELVQTQSHLTQAQQYVRQVHQEWERQASHIAET